METLLLDPHVEPGVEPVEPHVPQSRPQGIPANSGPGEIEVHACPGLAETQQTVLSLRQALACLPPYFVMLALISWPPNETFWFWIGGGGLFVYLLLLVDEKKRNFCELHIAPEWAEFVSLSNRRRVAPGDILRIVRRVPESDPGRLTELIVDLSSGQVSPLSDHKNILRVLRRFSPAAVVTTEEYDDRPD